MSSEKATRVNEVLVAFGTDERNLPEWNEGNFQHWMAAAVSRLEAERLVAEGEGAFWTSCFGAGAKEVAERCAESGRTWIEGERKRPENVDRKWGDEKVRSVGRLETNDGLSGRLTALDQLLERNRTD